jgi:DNA mismatch repair ATPase MutS
MRELNRLREQLEVDCHAAWLSFLAEFNAHYFCHKKAIRNIAILDVLFSLVQVAKQDGYCK